MKITKYILASMLILACSSCGDSWLDLEPSTYAQTDETINVLSDVAYALNGIYSTMQDPYAYSGRLVYYGDAAGDDMQAYSSTKRTGSAYLHSFTKDNMQSSYWSYPYTMITECNSILEQIDDIETVETDLRDYYKGQAYALRGMFLFDLTRIFGYPYKKDNGASLGAVIVKTVLDKDAKPARNTVAECYDAIIEDLLTAIDLMDNDEGNSYQKGHINRWGAMTLLSRVYLYHGDDQKALDMAKAAIEGAEAEGYSLWTTEEYPDAWSYDYSSSSKGEVLFEIVNTTDDDPGKEALGYLFHPDGYKDICLTSSFYELLMEDPDDVRLQLLVFSSKRAFVYKYQPEGDEIIQDANIPLLRLSETYLNAAEAAVKVGNNDDAVKYLDAIVRRANPANTVEGTEVTLERVMTERRKELVGEGEHYYDALRDGGYVDRHESSVTFSEISSTSHLTMDSDKMYFNWDYFRSVLPIPADEIDANPNMVQNPSYSSEN
ncbi:MAG: RagB/SusD family nutrient uptake outer membrane protein [Prevotella sp.]|nr:RagB/SusD family nutrient uptake outer membrane protein [Prevotella sp.]